MSSSIKKVVKPVDDYLRFIEEHFNVGNDNNYSDIVRQLNSMARQLSDLEYTSGSSISHGIVEKARLLARQLNDITLLTDLDKYKKFDKLGNFGLEGSGLIEAYKVSDDIIKDIRTARNWLRSYERFIRLSKRLKLNRDEGYTHDELILLGKSILARAVELCPMNKGNLRKSGTLYDMGDYIIITFTAPYASYVHENLEIAHPHHGGRNCGGRAKFLEIALQEFFPNKTVWTEILGHEGIYVKIEMNDLEVEYGHYG